MNIKTFIKKHRRTIIVLLVLFLASRILLGAKYVSKRDGTGRWRASYYQMFMNTSEFGWEGDLYYYGLHKPENVWVKANVDNIADDDFVKRESFGFWDERTEDYANFDRIILNMIAPSLLSPYGYCYMAETSRPRTIQMEIKWEENGEIKYTTIDYKR